MEPSDENQGNAELPESGELLIVGVGASAGGVKALQRFFRALPESNGVAFVVVVHLDPARESNLAQLLQSHTSLTVRQVTERVEIEGGHVYVIPPARSLSVADGHLDLSELETPRGRRAPIDAFFRSLARTPGGGVGIVLSGSGNDGTVGLKAIKEQGGLVMVQDPEDAEHDSMPRSAIDSGLVDFVLPAGELARKVVEYGKDRRRIRVPEDTHDLPHDDAEVLFEILARLRASTGQDFSNYKHSTVLRRIGRRMQMNRVETLSDYLRYLGVQPVEAQMLLKSFLIGVTHFFRDREAWEALAENVLPKLFRDRSPDGEVRVWVPGCATGEEAYTLTTLLLEKAARLGSTRKIQVFASDLDEVALAFARQGLYPETIAADVPEEQLRRMFTTEGDQYRVRKEIRERLLFAVHSLLKDPPFSKLDLISCRNLLIYLNRDLQEDVFRLFHYGLRPGGYLFLGSAESVDAQSGLFQAVDKKHRIYCRQETGEAPRLPALEISSRDSSEEGRAVTERRERTAPAELERHRRMLEHQAPPSVIVSSAYELLHLSDTAGRYLQRPGGGASNDILGEVRPELRLDLQAALHQAFQNGRRTSTRPVEVAFNGDVGWVHLIVQPGREEHGTQDRALVIFAEVETTDLTDRADREHRRETEAGDDARVRHLEAEAQNLRERLQATIEEYDSSKEEMRAANEELQSINEEYKSTAEELETSKEELQSVNEELETVNEELKTKLEELSETNSDLQNLMTSTEIGTLFLDRDLRIRRYTPRITGLFNVMSSDVGRPIAHLTHRIDYDALVEDARRVLRDLVCVERKVRGGEGTWFLARLRPYRTVEDRIEGVVITFVEITEIKRVEEELRTSKEYAEKIVDTVREGLLVLDAELRVQSANESFYSLFKVSPEKTQGHKVYDLGNKQWDIPGLRELLEKILPEQKVVTDFEVEYDFEEIGRRVMLVNARQVNHLERILVAIEDITERKQALSDLRMLNETLEGRVEARTRQVRELATRLTRTEQLERRRVSQILHDELQQLLYSIQMRVSVARQNAHAGGQERLIAEDLAQAEEWLKAAVTMTRRLTVDLSPPVLKSEGLADALLWLSAQMKELHELEVEVKSDEDVPASDEDMRILLFQIVRELLFNVVKHAGTDHARVEIQSSGDHRILRVDDEGRGFDVKAAEARREEKGGFGLFNARERLRLLGGRMEIDSAPGKGTRVIVRAPAQPQRPESSDT